MGKITHFILIIGVMAIAASLNLAGCKKPHITIVVEAPTTVYEDYPRSGPPTSKVVAVLNKGEKVEVLYSRWAKDFEYFKIRLKDGRTGYVGWDGKFKVENQRRR